MAKIWNNLTENKNRIDAQWRQAMKMSEVGYKQQYG
jgi:hypothetical protein